jgi:hypothetical protein
MVEWAPLFSSSDLDMIAAALFALSLFEAPQTHTVYRHVGGWTVKATTDRFTKAVTCSIRKGRVAFRNDVLIFHLGEYADTSEAVFRVDDGPARSVHDATYDDQRRGYYRRGGPLENPSAGEVALPSFYVTGAKWVYIRETPRNDLSWFNVSHFAEALALARSENCPDIGP